MWRATLKTLWSHKVRFALTALAVVLGVAFVSGTMILTDTMGRTFDGIFETANEGVDVVVYGGEAVDDGLGSARERVPAIVVEDVRAIDGVAAAEGSIQGFAQVATLDGTTSASVGFETTIGSNWITDERLNPLEIDLGRPPEGPDEVVLDKAAAEARDLTVGDRVVVLGKDAPREMELVGIATYGSADGLPGTTLVATDTATAQALFAEPGAFDSIVIAADDTTPAASLAARVERTLREQPDLPRTLDVVTGAEDTADKQAEMKDDLSFFSKFLLAFAYVALFVGTFIIHNTFSVVVAQRTRDLALLRAIGASRRQVLTSVLFEALVVGAVASALGLGLGVVLSRGLRAMLDGVGFAIPDGPLVLTADTVVVALSLGALVTVVSAVAPAWRAATVHPIEAMRASSVEPTRTSRVRAALGLLTTVGGAALFAFGTSSSGDSAMALLGGGALLTMLGVFVLGPAMVRPIIRVLGAPATRVSGETGVLARENARRNPRRTAATASALLIGVTLVAFTAIVAASTKSSVAATIDRSLRADYVIDSGSWSSGGFSPVLAEQLRALPEVAEVSPLRSAAAKVDGESAQLTAVDTATIEALYDLDLVAGSMADVRGNAIAVDADHAHDEGLAMSDTVTVTFTRTGDVELEVVALVGEPLLAAADPWIVALDTFEANVSDQYDRQVYVRAADGVDAATSRQAIERVLQDWPNAELQDQAGFKESITDEIDRMVNLMYGLLALAIVIALIGVANTLALAVHERTREIGLLRAVGMTRRQVRTAVRWESVMIAVLGCALGLTLAIPGAWGVVHALGREGITTFTVPGGQLAIVAVVAIAAGVLAAAGPARRAARLDVLAAIAAP